MVVKRIRRKEIKKNKKENKKEIHFELKKKSGKMKII